MARNGRLSYGADSDLDPNIIALINRKIESQVEGLIDDRTQRRQQWGPTFKQEGISNLTLPDAEFTIPSPEYGKRTLVFGGTLSAGRLVRLPPISSAWWIVRNNTAFPLTFLTWPNGVEGPTVESGKVEIVYTDGITVWRVTGPSAETTYTAEWRWTTGTLPASGQVGSNNSASYPAITEIYINESTFAGVDISAVLDALDVDDTVYIQDASDATKFIRAIITGPIVDNVSYRTIPVAIVDSGGAIANNSVVAVRLTAVGGGSGSGGGGAPGGSPTQLQYCVNATTFGGVTGSSVSLANVGLGGTLNIVVAPKSILLDPVSQAFGYMQFDRASPDLIDGDQTGAVVFKGRHGGGTTVQTGYLRSYWSDSFGPTVELGVASGTVRFAVAESATLKAATMISGTKYFQVDEGGLRTSEGAGGAILYQDGAPLYLKALDIGLENQILKVTDIGGGVLRPRWGVASSAGGVPEGIATELQSRDPSGTAFKRVAGSSVSGGDVGLAGDLSFSGADVSRKITFNRTGADLVDSNIVGQIIFNGMVGSTLVNYGFIRSLKEDSMGGKVVDIGVGAYSRLVISETASTLLQGSNYFHVRPDGLRISGGTQGSLFYQDDVSGALFFKPLTIGANNTFLRSDSVRPGWTALTMAHISGVLPISQGGTGLAITTPGEPLDGQLLIGNGGGFALSTITAGLNVTINNTAGHITISATAGAASQRLDQILSPLAATDFNMAGWQVRYRYDGAVPAGGVLIDSTSNAASGGVLLHVRNTYTDDSAARLLLCQVGSGVDYPLAVTHIGSVGMGGVPNPSSPITDTYRLQIFAPSGGNALLVAGTARFSGGTNWGVYYLNGTTQNLTTSAAAAGFLKSTGSAPPVFTPISMTDVSGTVPITQGGTGLTTSPIGAGQILIGNGTTYALGTITNGGGISVSYTGGNIQLTATSTTPRLDQILSPTAATNFDMAGWQARFRYDGAVPAGGVLIDSTANAASGGTLLWVRNTYSDNNAARLFVCQINSGADYPLAVTHIGAVGMGGVPNAGTPTLADTFRLQIFSASGANGLYVSGQTRLDHAGGVNWGIYYRDANGNIVTSPAGVGFVKKTSASVAPSFATTIALGTEVSGTLPVANGGTGLGTPPPAGQLLIGNGTVYALGSITNGGGISVSYTGGNIQLTATGGSVNDSLDTIVDPFANSELVMGGFQVRFRWNGAVPLGGMLIDSTTTSASQGVLLHIRNTYSDDNAARLLLCQINSAIDYPLAVTHIGAVGMGGVPTDAGSATFRLQVFAPSSGTLNALYASGQVNFNIPGMSDNSLYYRASGGNLAGIPAAVTAGRVAMSDGSTWAARAITIVGGSVTYTGGVLQITPPAGTGSPGTPVSGLQWNNAGTFDGVENSVVTTGGLVTLGEQSATLANALLTLQKTGAAGANVGNGHSIGKILFQGLLGTMQDFGTLEGLYNTTPLKTLRLGQGVLSAGNAYRVLSLKDSGEIGMEVSNGSQTTTVKLDVTGIILTPGSGSFSSNGTYYRDSFGYIVTTGSGGTNTYLKTALAGSGPLFATIQPSDIAAGAFTDGFRITFNPNGTNAGLNVGQHTADPSTGTSTVGDIYYNSSTGKFRAYQGSSPAWTDMIGAGGSLSIDGSGTELLRRTSGSSLQTISNSSVSGDDITIGGRLTQTDPVTATGITHSIDRTMSGSSNIGNDYSALYWYHTSGTGTATSRKCLTLAFEYTGFSSIPTSTNGDAILELYAQSQNSPTVSGAIFHGLVVEVGIAATVNTVHQIRVKPCNTPATTKRAITVESGAGDVVFNAGTILAQTAAQGFVMIPTITIVGGAPPADRPQGSPSIPTGCAALAVGTDNALWANRGLGWMKVFFS